MIDWQKQLRDLAACFLTVTSKKENITLRCMYARRLTNEVIYWIHFWWTVRIQRNMSQWCLTRKTLWDTTHTVSSASIYFTKCELSMNSAYSFNCGFMKLCIDVLLLKTFKVYQYWSFSWHPFCEAFIYLLLWFEHFIHAYYVFWSLTPLVPSSPIPQLSPMIFPAQFRVLCS